MTPIPLTLESCNRLIALRQASFDAAQKSDAPELRYCEAMLENALMMREIAELRAELVAYQESELKVTRGLLQVAMELVQKITK